MDIRQNQKQKGKGRGGASQVLQYRKYPKKSGSGNCGSRNEIELEVEINAFPPKTLELLML